MPLNNLKDEEVALLVDILNHDAALNDSLGTSMEPPITLDEFKRTGADWQKRCNAITYCIWVGKPVGTISLSYLTDDGQARIGYWLTSAEWGKGIATQAFAQVLEIARHLGVRQVRSVIDRGNEASLRLWRRYAAQETPLDSDRIQACLNLA